jgi:RsmE family RNA methyltransferase
MQRIYIENLETVNFNFVLKDKNIIHQLSRVLRSKPWDEIIFFDGKDYFDYIFKIKEISKTEIFFEQIWRIEKNNKLDFELNLFQAIPNKMDKIESIIKNWTQIWVSNFLFFKATHSQKLIVSDKKEDRLRKIIIESVELCGRNDIPWLIIGEKINFLNLSWKNIFLHTKDDKSKKLKDLKVNGDKIINLFIWPEGWFSNDEIWRFEKNNFEKVFLWDNILRTELAWIASSFYLIQNNL